MMMTMINNKKIMKNLRKTGPMNTATFYFNLFCFKKKHF